MGVTSLLLKTSAFFLEQGDTTEWLKSCLNLGVYYSQIQNKSKAREYYTKVLKNAQGVPNNIYYSIVAGYTSSMEEDTIFGLPIFEKALRISQDCGYSFMLAQNYNDLARYYYRTGNYHEAAANARKALKYGKQYGEEGTTRTAMGVLADVYALQKNYAAAYRMESDRNSLLSKQHKDLDKNLFIYLNNIDSLLTWVETAVPAPNKPYNSIHKGTSSVSNLHIFRHKTLNH